MSVDILSLWDFGQPAESEQRFREALTTATPDEALILQTQIARSYGLRRDFVKATEILAELHPQLVGASAEANVRYYLELGRTLCSPIHPRESQTEEVKTKAGAAYTDAFNLAQASGLDYLAVDALHMMAMVVSDPEAQLQWDLKALEYMEASAGPEAKKWEGSLRHNIGYALHLQGRYAEALDQFEQALAFREAAANQAQIRVAHWMIAWTLRAMGRLDEALVIQLRLEQEWLSNAQPAPYVFEELEHLYRALGNSERADHYAAMRALASS